MQELVSIPGVLLILVKSGIIASRWGAHFNGKPHFLIDAKLFPGSSSSIVLSKPIDIVVKEGQILHAKETQFAFLGIYSGEPLKLDRPIELEDMIITQKTGFNVGVVWYAELTQFSPPRVIENSPPPGVRWWWARPA